MRFETKRERERRWKKQRRSAILGMLFAFAVVAGLGLVIWKGKLSLEVKNKEYLKQISELEQDITEENIRADELSEYRKYVQTKKFVEEIAKNKFGLIYPDEIVFKENNK